MSIIRHIVLVIFLLNGIGASAQSITVTPIPEWTKHDSSKMLDACFYDNHLYTIGVRLTKWDTLGNIVWEKPQYFGHQIAIDSSHNIVVLGSLPSTGAAFDTTVLTSAGGTDIMLLKIDTAGNLIWAKNYGNSLNDTANQFCIDHGNNIFINCKIDSSYYNFIHKYSSTGTLLFSKPLVDSSLVFWQMPTRNIAYSASDSTVLVSGGFSGKLNVDGYNITALKFTNMPPYGNDDFYILKFKASTGSAVFLRNVSQNQRWDFDNTILYAHPVSGNIIANYTRTFLAIQTHVLRQYNTTASNWGTAISDVNNSGITLPHTDFSTNSFIWSHRQYANGTLMQLKHSQSGATLNYLTSPLNTSKFIFSPTALYYSYNYIDTNSTPPSQQSGVAKIGLPYCFVNSSASTQIFGICSTQTPFIFNGQALYTSGTYYDTIANAVGCDSFMILHLTIATPPTSPTIINHLACSSYQFAGQLLTTSGTYYDTLINGNGCDSIVMLNLTITSSSSYTMNQTACDSFVFDSQTVSSSGIYYDTLVNASSCDSFITLNLTINHSSYTTINEIACDSFIFDSHTFSSSGIYYDTLVNASGCDSFVTLNLTINHQSYSALNETACDSFIFGAQTLSSSGIYYDTLVNPSGCDSFVTLNLTINHPSSQTISDTACNIYLFNGQTLTSSGTYYDTFSNIDGCDSIISLQLQIKTINTSITKAAATLSSNEPNAFYQWLSCPAFSIIPGATSQTYIATSNGSYAVRLTNQHCSDTSDCINVTELTTAQVLEGGILIYPNPTTGLMYISSATDISSLEIKLFDATGKLLESKQLTSANKMLDLSDFAAGVYQLEVLANRKMQRVKVLKY
jgi:hypothetical protein